MFSPRPAASADVPFVARFLPGAFPSRSSFISTHQPRRVHRKGCSLPVRLRSSVLQVCPRNPLFWPSPNYCAIGSGACQPADWWPAALPALSNGCDPARGATARRLKKLAALSGDLRESVRRRYAELSRACNGRPAKHLKIQDYVHLGRFVNRWSVAERMITLLPGTALSP